MEPTVAHHSESTGIDLLTGRQAELLMTLHEWIERYGRAWETADKELTLSLFTEDAIYRSQIFREPSVGHEGIGAYWECTRGQEGVRVRFGRPVVEGNHAAVEWWTTMVEEGREVTLPGCLLLRFAPDGRCEELREYWELADGYREPPPGWGE